MMALWEESNVTVKALGERLYLDSGTLTPLLKKMETQGLVLRERSPQDERNVYITLTDKGIALKETALSVPSQIGSCFSLPKEDAVQLQKTLRIILEQLVDS
jgi:DNA-binding MarR family transcriptional regulator